MLKLFLILFVIFSFGPTANVGQYQINLRNPFSKIISVINEKAKQDTVSCLKYQCAFKYNRKNCTMNCVQVCADKKVTLYQNDEALKEFSILIPKLITNVNEECKRDVENACNSNEGKCFGRDRVSDGKPINYKPVKLKYFKMYFKNYFIFPKLNDYIMSIDDQKSLCLQSNLIYMYFNVFQNLTFRVIFHNCHDSFTFLFFFYFFVFFYFYFYFFFALCHLFIKRLFRLLSLFNFSSATITCFSQLFRQFHSFSNTFALQKLNNETLLIC